MTRSFLGALRRLRRRPGQSAAAVLLLAVGIAAATGVYAVVEATLLRPLPFPSPDQLALVWGRSAADPRLPLPAPFVPELQAEATSLARVSYILGTEEAALETDDGAVGVRTNVVAWDLFDLLGVVPAVGRLIRPGEVFLRDDDDASAGPVLLGHAFWQSSLGADPAIVGRAIRLDGAAAYVVGVLPAGFRLPLPREAGMASTADVWRPIRVPLASFHRDVRLRDQDSDNRGIAVARLAPEASLVEAQAELARLAPALWRVGGAFSDEGLGLRLVPLQEDATEAVRPLLALLTAAVALLLVLIAGNVAGLLLAAALDRQPELAVRAALGGSRRQVMAPLAAEALLLGVTACVLGLVGAAWVTNGLLALWPDALPRPVDAGLDPTVLLLGIVVAALATGIATLLPVFRGSRISPLLVVRGSGSVADVGDTMRIRRVLVTGELALAVVFMIGAGLLVETFVRLRQIDPGFHAADAVTFDLSLVARDRYRGPADRSGFVRLLEERLRAIPGVQAVGTVAGAPLSGVRFTQPWGRPGEPPAHWSGAANYRVITEGYFEAMGSGTTEGRPFLAADDRQDHRVAIVDETLARQLAQRGTAVGQRIGIPVDGDPVEAEIVGVAPTIRYDDLQVPGRPTVYVPYRHEASRRVTVTVRSARPAADLQDAVKTALADLDPNLPVFRYRSMAGYVRDATAAPRFALALLAGFSVLTGLIALSGLYALVAHSLARRVPEIGVRMALGADSRSIATLVARDGFTLLVPALLIGAIGGVVLARLMTGLLFGVSTVEPLTLLVTAFLTVATVAAAALGPAVRATALDPAEALRRS